MSCCITEPSNVLALIRLSEVEAPVATLSETAPLFEISDQSWLPEFAPVRVKAPVAALSETAPLVSGDPLVPSAEVSVTIADDVPFLLVVASRSPEQLHVLCSYILSWIHFSNNTPLLVSSLQRLQWHQHCDERSSRFDAHRSRSGWLRCTCRRCHRR